MRTLKRNKRRVYLCKRIPQGKLIKYAKPIPLYENYVPTNTGEDLVSLGLEYPMFLRIKTDIQEKDLFHPKDRLYVYKNPPKEYDPLCDNADYEVYKEPLCFINEMEVMLKRLSDDTDE